MKGEFLSLKNTIKMKAAAVVLCGALIAAIGVGTAYAANSKASLQVKAENGVRSYSTDEGKTWNQQAPEGVTVDDKDGKLTIKSGIEPKDGEGEGLLCKEENGIRSYSTDEGKTWSQQAPEGVTVDDKDGKVTIKSGIAPKDGEGEGLLCKVENGVRSYSTDGGKTWSEKAPDGAEDSITIGE